MSDSTVEKVQAMTGEISDQINEAIKKAIDDLGLATKDDIEDLKNEIRSLNISVKE